MGRKRITPKQTIERLQDLVGRALSAYENDRDPQRAESVTVPLREAFQLCVSVRERWKP